MQDSLLANEALELPESVRTPLEKMMVEKTLELPLLPESAGRVLVACQDVDCDIEQLEKLIRGDQAMTSHVLRLSNSPLYAPSSPVVSLKQALARLGIMKISEIAVLISCESRVFQVKGYEDEVQKVFRHSLGAACFAQEIARKTRNNLEAAYLVGLLHDVGRPILLQAAIDVAKKQGLELSRPALEFFVEQHHAQVGASLIYAWSLPDLLCEPILFHHRPEEAGQDPQMCALTTLADTLSHFAVETAEVCEEQIRQHPAVSQLDLDEQQVSNLIDKAEDIRDLVNGMGS